MKREPIKWENMFASNPSNNGLSPKYIKNLHNSTPEKQIELHQTKKFCRAKEIINKIKRQPTEWENIFTHTSDKGLISKIYKVLKNNAKKPTTQVKNGQRT